VLLIFGIVFLAILTMIELKVKMPRYRLILVLGVIIIMLALLGFWEVTNQEQVNLSLYSRLFSKMMNDLTALAESGQDAALRERLHKLRDELPQAIYNYNHLTYLVDQMQFIGGSSGEMAQGDSAGDGEDVEKMRRSEDERQK